MSSANRPKANTKRKAFSFVEIMVASSIGIFLMIPLMAIFFQSQQQTQQSFDEIQAVFLAREVVDQMQTMKHVLGFQALAPISDYRSSSPWGDISNLKNNSLYSDTHLKKTHAFSKLHLTSLPDGYRRYIKLYPANQSSGTSYEPRYDLLQLLVKIEWKSFTSRNYDRAIQIAALIAKDEVLEN